MSLAFFAVAFSCAHGTGDAGYQCTIRGRLPPVTSQTFMQRDQKGFERPRMLLTGEGTIDDCTP